MTFKPKKISKERIKTLEWQSSATGPIRQKGIRTIMKRRKVTYEKAKLIQSQAIAKNE